MSVHLACSQQAAPWAPQTYIFHSEDLFTNTDLLAVLIQGVGAVRPGQWARALCINDSLDTGSMLPAITMFR